MQELIERLEKATGPDRELDGLIFKVLAGKPGDEWYLFDDGVWCRRCREDSTAFDTPRVYTGSIDAALTLVPPDFDWCAGTDDDVPVAALTRPHEGPWTWNNAATPAIALCIAALKARLAMAEHKPQQGR